MLLLFKHPTELLDLNFSESSELNLLLLILESCVSDQLRMVHLKNFELLVSGRKFRLELLAFKSLNLLNFIDLLFINFIELSGCLCACLLDLIMQFLDMIVVLILLVLHVFFILSNLCFKGSYLRLHFGLFSLP